LYGKDFWVRKQLLAVATIVSALLLTSCTQAGQRSTADAATGTASATAVNVNSAAESLSGSTEGGVGGATGESETSTETPTSTTPAVKQIGIYGTAGDYDPLNTGHMFNGQIAGVVTNARDLNPDYVVDSGQIYLDLSGMETLTEPKTVSIYINSGHFDLKMPKNVPVDLTCKVPSEKSNCKTKKYNSDAPGSIFTLNITSNTARVTIAKK
jgi:lipoprotein